MQRSIFLILSLISGWTELSCIFLGMTMDLSVLQIAGLGLAYQIGNLVPNPLRISRVLTVFTAVGATAAFGLVRFAGGWYPALVLGYILLAVTLQSLRSVSKEEVSTTAKRSCRILGFLVAPFLPMEALLLTGGVLTAIALGARQLDVTQFRAPTLRWLASTMVVHQMHYFTYAYFMMMVIADLFGDRPLLIGVWFALGWITYSSVPHLYRGKAYARYFAGGHLFLGLTLPLLAWQADTVWAAILWVVTGFGGGTVYCIERLNYYFSESKKEDVVFAENLGHVLGVVAGMAVYLMVESVKAPILLAAGFALSAMGMMLSHQSGTRGTKSFHSNAGADLQAPGGS